MQTSTTPTCEINEGKIAHFLIPCVFLGIAALISFVFFWPLGIILTLICIGLASAESGLEFDSTDWKFRRFHKVFGKNMGKWKRLNNEGHFHLVLSVDVKNFNRLFPISNSYYGSAKSQSKSITYNLIFIPTDEANIIIYEFESYKKLLVAARFIIETTKFEVTDHIAIKLEENRLKRNQRL